MNNLFIYLFDDSETFIKFFLYNNNEVKIECSTMTVGWSLTPVTIDTKLID